MRITVKTGIISALCWIALKMVFFFSGIFRFDITPSILLNILFLLLAISIGMYLQKKGEKEPTSMLFDIKNAMSVGLPYIIIVCTFIFFYYSKIDKEFIAQKIERNNIEIEKIINDPKKLAEFKGAQPEAEVMSKESIEKRLKENNVKGASAGFTATVATLALLLLSTFYSIVVSWFYRKFIFNRF